MFMKKHDERIKFVFLIIILVFLIIFFKILYVQVFSYEKLSTLSDDLWSRELPISAARGKILDRNGVVLADNITITSLIFIPNQITEKERVAKVISEILDVDYDDMYQHVTKNTSIERVHPEGRNLSYEIADEINSYNFD